MKIDKLINILKGCNNLSISEVNTQDDIVLTDTQVIKDNNLIKITGINEDLENYTYILENNKIINIDFDEITITITTVNDTIMIENW